MLSKRDDKLGLNWTKLCHGVRLSLFGYFSHFEILNVEIVSEVCVKPKTPQIAFSGSHSQLFQFLIFIIQGRKLVTFTAFLHFRVEVCKSYVICFYNLRNISEDVEKSREEGKDQESIQSSTIPDSTHYKILIFFLLYITCVSDNIPR